jgi:hypothetical protein
MDPTAVQRTYTAGSTVEFRVGVSTHHWGHYEFRLCDHKLDKSMPSKQDGQNCLNDHVLHRAPRSAACGSETLGDCQYNNPNHPGRWYLPPPGSSQEKDERGNEVHIMKYVIPADLMCEECTLQWYYATGNTCAYDEDYLTFDPGFKYWLHYKAAWTTKENAVCGPDGNGDFGEEFWNCADINVAVAPGSTEVQRPMPTPTSPQDNTPLASTPISPEPEPEPEPKPNTLPAAGNPCHQQQCGCPDAQGQFPDATVDWCTLETAAKSGNEWCHASAEQCSQCSGGVYCADATTPLAPPTPTSALNPTPVPTPLSAAPTSAPASSDVVLGGSCRNPECGCPPFTGGKSWCQEDNSKYGDWCAQSEENCAGCHAVWCVGSSLTQTRRSLRIQRHRAGEHVLLQSGIPLSEEHDEL